MKFKIGDEIVVNELFDGEAAYKNEIGVVLEIINASMVRFKPYNIDVFMGLGGDIVYTKWCTLSPNRIFNDSFEELLK